ncbi:hypothetical protein NP493_493g02004 [Ridgeia piscesae]|uniref:Uncharacterized protein n=1 Tax=Ridgeia piscesae TaxID=27915 RepID=A0AAD9NU14_RIDPI|nr:hypothetical protein NP493_493g02004 [Ridgeia piscesae]
MDGDESILSSCVAHILANVDIEHPVGHVINSALQCHHDNYHSCTKSLLVMTSLWLREMDCLVQQGVPLDAVLSGFHQAIEQCVRQLQVTKTAVEDVLKSFKPTQSLCTDGHNSGTMLDDSSDDRLQSHNAGRMLNPGSGDILPAVSNGMTLLSGEDRGVKHDILSSCEVKTECQLNSARVPEEPLMSDKEAKMASIMEELSKTSQLLVR